MDNSKQPKQKKQPKTIFGTTEKSNFILNMKADTLQNWIAALLAACVIVPQIVGFLVYGLNASPVFMSAGLYFTGFACILFFLIAMIKGRLSFKEDKILWVIAFMAVWAFISYYGVVLRVNSAADSQSSEIINTALSGEIGRYEGLLSLLAYFGIFCLAACVTREKTVSLIVDVIIGAGVVQALFAVFQHIPGLRFMPNFADLPTVALKDVMLSSGLSENPIVFGSFLTIVFSLALKGAVSENNKTKSRIYCAAALLFWLVGFFTSSIVPIIGMFSAFVIVTLKIFFSKEPLSKDNTYSYAVLAIGMSVIFALIWIFQGIYIRDKAIAYYDAYFRLFIVTSYSYVNKQSLYDIGLEKSLYFIKEHPILGIGPDLLAKYQLTNPELAPCSIDRSYNEIVYTAATRGIPAAAAYIVFLFAAVKKAFGGFKAALKDNSDWYGAAIFTAIAAYIIQSFFSFSSVLCAPMFWLLCGLAFRKITDKIKE